MISSVFGYSDNCFKNVRNAVAAYKAGDIDTLSKLSDTFLAETGKGVAKLVAASVNTEIIEHVAAETNVSGIFSLLTPLKAVTAVTTIVNGIATVATGAVAVAATYEKYNNPALTED